MQTHLTEWRSSRASSPAGNRVRDSLGMGVRPCHFVRTHVPTGSTWAGDFNGSHAAEWSDENWQHTSRARLMQLAMELVKRWNSGPERTLWRYELESGNAAR